jgi:hypothetical protein
LIITWFQSGFNKPLHLQVYGWGVLIAGAAIAYGMARPSIEERRRIATENGERPLEIKTCALLRLKQIQNLSKG